MNMIGPTRCLRASIAILALTMTGACGILGPSDLDDLEEHRSLWRASGFTDYSYVINRGCFCGTVGLHRVTIRAGEVVGVTRLDDNVDLDPVHWNVFRSVDGVFDLLEDALESADEVDVTYDRQLGFPREISIDYLEDAVDDELWLELQTPVPLE